MFILSGGYTECYDLILYIFLYIKIIIRKEKRGGVFHNQSNTHARGDTLSWGPSMLRWLTLQWGADDNRQPTWEEVTCIVTVSVNWMAAVNWRCFVDCSEDQLGWFFSWQGCKSWTGLSTTLYPPPAQEGELHLESSSLVAAQLVAQLVAALLAQGITSGKKKKKIKKGGGKKEKIKEVKWKMHMPCLVALRTWIIYFSIWSFVLLSAQFSTLPCGGSVGVVKPKVALKPDRAALPSGPD